jgi:hypothetical protein
MPHPAGQQWQWSGSVTGPIHLRDGIMFELAGRHGSSAGVAVRRHDSTGLQASRTDWHAHAAKSSRRQCFLPAGRLA